MAPITQIHPSAYYSGPLGLTLRSSSPQAAVRAEPPKPAAAPSGPRVRDVRSSPLWDRHAAYRTVPESLPGAIERDMQRTQWIRTRLWAASRFQDACSGRSGHVRAVDPGADRSGILCLQWFTARTCNGSKAMSGRGECGGFLRPAGLISAVRFCPLPGTSRSAPRLPPAAAHQPVRRRIHRARSRDCPSHRPGPESAGRFSG